MSNKYFLWAPKYMNAISTDISFTTDLVTIPASHRSRILTTSGTSFKRACHMPLGCNHMPESATHIGKNGTSYIYNGNSSVTVIHDVLFSGNHPSLAKWQQSHFGLTFIQCLSIYEC